MRPLVFSVILIVCSACQSTGGTMFGLFPAPKFPSGSVDDSIYTAKGGSFSIAVPHPQGSYEYRYLNVKEVYEADDAYISFGPGPFDRTIYRVEVAWRMTEDAHEHGLHDIVPGMMKAYGKELEPQGGPLELVSQTPEVIGGRDGLQLVMKQRMRHEEPRASEFTHEVYVMEHDIAIVIVWVQKIGDAPNSGISPREFAESFSMHASGPPGRG